MSKLTFFTLFDQLRHRCVGLMPAKTVSHSKMTWAQPLFAEENKPEPTPDKNTEHDANSNANRPPKVTGQDGPPDLDVLWNDFNRRLGNLFGGKSENNSKTTEDKKNNFSQGSPKEPERDSKSSQFKTSNSSGGGSSASGPSGVNFKFPKIGLGLVITVLVAIWVISGFFIVQEGQAGVVLQFGKYKYTARPGINWRLPYPVQTHEIVNLSGVRSVEIGRPVMIQATNLKDSSMLTEDENIIDVRFAVQYKLKDPTEYLFTNRDPDAGVIQAAETAIREIVGRSKMDTVLYEGREKIAIDLAASIQKILDSYKSGVLITSVTVQNVQPPEQVQASFDDAVKAGQDQERLKNEGQAYANEIIPRARGTAARLLEEAQGYKAKVVAMAEGDASRFKQIYVEYAKAPQVTKDRMYIDTMQQIFNNVTKVMVDTKTSNPLLYLPLDKIMQQSNSDANASPGNNGANTSAPTAPVLSTPSSTLNPTTVPPMDKRDALRSRDRDAR